MTGVPGTSDFPATLDSHTTLLQVRDLASTTVGAGGWTSSATSLLATSTSLYPATGAITCEGEHIIYTSKDATHFLGCTRGAFTSLGGAAAATHAAAALIKQLVIAATHEVHSDAIIATQTKLGSGADTPTSGDFLKGTGAGTSAWAALTSGDVNTALGFTAAEGPIVQQSDTTIAATANTLDFDGAYFTVTESPAKEANVTFASGAAQDAGTLTIAAGVLTLPGIKANVAVIRATIDTESAAATDDLDTITPTGSVATGTILILTTLSSSRDVTAKNGTGNLTLTDGDFVMGTTGYRLMLVRTGTSWVELARQPLSTTYQVLDAELSALAGLTSAADRLPYFTGSGAASLATFTAAGRALIDDADAAAQRTTLGLVIGTNVQAQDAELAAIAGLTSAADKLPYFTGSGTAALADLSAAGRALIDDADAAAQRATLGVQPGSISFFATVIPVVWTDMPAAETVFGAGAAQVIANFAHATEFNFSAFQWAQGYTSAVLRLKYWTGSAWAQIASVSGAGDLECFTAPTAKQTGWIAMAAGARGDGVLVQPYGQSGNAVFDPSWSIVRMEYR